MDSDVNRLLWITRPYAGIIARMGEGGRERLGQAMGARRRELRLSIRAAATIAQVDRATWSSTESGTRTIAPYNHAGIEKALGWAPGSVGAVLAGGDPALAAGREGLSGSAPDDELANEINRIKTLRISPAARLAMLRALIDLHAEAEGAADPVERRTG